MATVQVRATRRSTGRVRLRALVAAGAVLTATTLGACSGHPGAAAVVDGRSISVSEVQDATVELAPFYQGVTQGAVVTVLVQEPVVSDFAAQHGVGVSDDDAKAALAKLKTATVSGEGRTFSDASVSVERFLLASAAIQAMPDAATVSPDLTALLAKQHITLSSRFGTVGDGNTIGETVHPWIVATPAA